MRELLRKLQRLQFGLRTLLLLTAALSALLALG